MPFTGSVSDLSNGAEGRSSFYQRLFYFCFCFEPVKHGRVILPPLTEQPVRTEGAEEEDTWLPKTDIPNVIQQKVITGKREGGYVQQESLSEEIMSPTFPMGKPRIYWLVTPEIFG